MKRIFKKNTVSFVLMIAMMIFQMTAVSAKEIDQMPELEAGRTGTLSAELSYKNDAGKDVAIPGVTLEAVKVADLTVINGGSSTYTLTSDFAESGIDFEGMTASESNEAAKALKSIVLNKSLTGQSRVTDEKGQVCFENLEPAMYLILQTANEDLIPLYTEMDPYLISVPLGKNENGAASWQYVVKSEPKLEIVSKPRTGQITVTKKVSIETKDDFQVLTAVDAVFHFGIFKDAEGKIPFRENYIQSIQLENASAGTTVFTELPEGVYYIFEIDQNGNIIRPGSTVNGIGRSYTCILEGSENNAVTVDLTSTLPDGEITFNNVYPELPEGYYLEGKIQIKKNVFQDKDRVKVNDTFYAGIFTKEDGTYILNQIVELKQNGTVSVPVVLSGDSGEEYVEYWIFETNKNGKQVDKESFSYEVSGEGAVKLHTEKMEGSVEITNRIKKEAVEEPTETSSDNAVRTGDDTPVMTFAVAAAAALLVMILLVIAGVRRKRSN